MDPSAGAAARRPPGRTSLGLRLAVVLAASGLIGAAHAGDSPAPPAVPPKTRPAAPTRILRGDLAGLLGRQVQGKARENMGRIIDILVNQEGQATAAVIDFGGFLGVGSRDIAVDWHDLHLAPASGADTPVTLDFTAQELTSAPSYEVGKPVVVLRAGPAEPSTPGKPSAN